MKYLHVIPKEDTYIDGRLVLEYKVLATQEEINKAYARTHKNRGQKPVYQYDMAMSLVGIHGSITEAAKAIGGSRTHIGQVIDHGKWTSGGFIWKSKLR